jgi:deoxyribodipyrimidine photo-lyase
MFDSLNDLAVAIKSAGGKFYIFQGKPVDVVRELVSKYSITAVGFNKDFSPYAKKRDAAISKIAGIQCYAFDDLKLVPEIRTGNGGIYQKFTPFYNKASKQHIPKPVKFSGEFARISHKSSKLPDLSAGNDIHGGRTEGLKVLARAGKIDYSRRDYLAENGTTGLSPYNRFGVISAREVYHAVGTDIRVEMFWRDFYFGVIDEFGLEATKRQYAALRWPGSNAHFRKWCNGLTGFPIVDAGMRQLTQSGHMHNRSRMITSNFLVKVLGINWKKGEKFFAQHLIDYDIAQNNGGWQWSAGTGADSQPYFRVFNPHTQAKKYDPNCEYIKKWVPELRDVDNKAIHAWQGGVAYPAPCIDYAAGKKRMLAEYKRITK